MTTLEIILIVSICGLLIIVGMIYSGNEDNAKMIDELKSENEDLKNQLRPNGFVCRNSNGVAFDYAELHRLNFENKDLKFYNDIKTRAINNLQKENDELKKKIVSMKNGIDGEVKIINGRRFVDDRIYTSVPPHQGKSHNRIFQELVFNGYIPEDFGCLSIKPKNDNKCGDTELTKKVELLQEFELTKDKVRGFIYKGIFDKDIVDKLKELYCETTELDLIAKTIKFKYDKQLFEAKAGDFIGEVNSKLCVIERDNFFQKYTPKKES